MHHRTAEACAKAWLENADFLLSAPSRDGFTHAVGNPPYIRWAKIPDSLKATYTEQLSSDMTGGDLFLPFLDYSLDQLRPNGRCGSFAQIVGASWPSPRRSDVSGFLLWMSRALRRSLHGKLLFPMSAHIHQSIIAQKRPKNRQTKYRQLNKKGKTLKEMGYIVKVGPALGHTPAFVLEPDEHDVEPQLLQPWIDSSEISEGTISWRGRKVIATFDDDGHLIDLDRYPLLVKRLEAFKSTLSQRSIVRNGAPWYRSIDRVRAVDWRQPKIVVPELAKIPRLALDHSGAIPSHGVYAIFAAEDDLKYLYEKLCNGGLAHALTDISPKVKGDYFRCYKKFLLDIRISM